MNQMPLILDIKQGEPFTPRPSACLIHTPAPQNPSRPPLLFNLAILLTQAQMLNHGGSGLTFIIVPDEFTVGRPGTWLGMLNDACQEDYKAVAIVFDTRQNPEFGDPNDNHVGINLGSIVSTTIIDASDFGVFLNDGSAHRAWITYDGPRRWMESTSDQMAMITSLNLSSLVLLISLLI